MPTKELEPTKLGWQRYYFHAIKQTYLPYLRNNETKIAKLVKWFNILNKKFNLMMGNIRFGQLTDNQVREMYIDFDNANNNLKKISVTHNVLE